MGLQSCVSLAIVGFLFACSPANQAGVRNEAEAEVGSVVTPSELNDGDEFTLMANGDGYFKPTAKTNAGTEDKHCKKNGCCYLPLGKLAKVKMSGAWDNKTMGQHIPVTLLEDVPSETNSPYCKATGGKTLYAYAPSFMKYSKEYNGRSQTQQTRPIWTTAQTHTGKFDAKVKAGDTLCDVRIEYLVNNDGKLKFNYLNKCLPDGQNFVNLQGGDARLQPEALDAALSAMEHSPTPVVEPYSGELVFKEIRAKIHFIKSGGEYHYCGAESQGETLCKDGYLKGLVAAMDAMIVMGNKALGHVETGVSPSGVAPNSTAGDEQWRRTSKVRVVCNRLEAPVQNAAAPIKSNHCYGDYKPVQVGFICGNVVPISLGFGDGTSEVQPKKPISYYVRAGRTIENLVLAVPLKIYDAPGAGKASCEGLQEVFAW